MMNWGGTYFVSGIQTARYQALLQIGSKLKVLACRTSKESSLSQVLLIFLTICALDFDSQITHREGSGEVARLQRLNKSVWPGKLHLLLHLF